MLERRVFKMENTPTVMKVIPKKITPVVNVETGITLKRKVAAYARVSTDLLDQKNSFNAQKEEYESRISKNPDWEFVGLYADEGISGTSTKNRKEFKQMIDDATHGKIDLILVKSISRFARNTVDCLQTVRDLRKANVEVWFDKESISTNDKKVDIMLTMFASFAQEESKSISENVKWGVRKRMAKGQRKMHTATTLGYVTAPDGKVVVDESEREIVKEVFNLYLCGYSMYNIANIMTGRNIPTGTGNRVWQTGDVLRILNSEKYIGEFVMQKTVVQDFLDHKAYVNDGLEEKYILENHHEPIISKEQFELVKTIRQKKVEAKDPTKVVNILFGIVVCEHCLRPMKFVYVHPSTSYKRAVLTCKTTAKVSENYRICDIQNTLDYELVKIATGDVFSKYSTLKNEVVTLISGAYEKAMEEIAIKTASIKKENEALQEELASIIKTQLKSTDMDTLKFKYDQTKKKLDYNNDLYLKLIDEAYKTYKKEMFQMRVCEYKNNPEILTYQLVRTIIKLVIRREDNSIRFVIGDDEPEINRREINKLLSLEPIYTSMIKGYKGELRYDVVKIGGNKDGN